MAHQLHYGSALNEGIPEARAHCTLSEPQLLALQATLRKAAMYLSTALLVAYGLSEAAVAFKLPFHVPWVSARLNSEQAPLVLPQEQTTPRIAIVGAGAGGSSAAFWISKAKERYGLDVEVDIYDSKSYIGGREFHQSSYAIMRCLCVILPR